MLSEEKIKKMLRLSEYETGQGKTDLLRVRYLKMDYIRLEIIKTVASVSAASVLILGLYMLYQADYIFENALSLPFRDLAVKGALLFFPVCLLSILFTWYIAGRAYDESHVRAGIYYQTLRELIELYEDEEQGQEETVS